MKIVAVHEIEYMIRLVLQAGPQRGRNVRAWVGDASGYSDRKVRQVAAAMVEQGDLLTGAWALPAKNGIKALSQSLEACLPKELPPSVEELPEIIEREWRELRGEDV